MRCGIDFYRHAFQHEIAADAAMLKMLHTVPEESRSDARFQQAVNISAHMASCRQNFLDLFKELTTTLDASFEVSADIAKLDSSFAKMESEWKEYLAQINDERVEGRFVFIDNGEKWSISLEAQLFQLVGHAAYHRGQVVLLVDSLGGTTFNTDYIDWFTEHHPEGWGVVS